MLIPSIDLMGGKIVQLVQGEKKKLEFDDFEFWIERFSKYPIVQLIDLDAARATGNNRQAIRKILPRLNCQVGGGIRTAQDARELLDAGAKKVIFGSSLFRDGETNLPLVRSLADALGTQPLIFALDSRSGRVAIDGWRTKTAITALDMVHAFDPFCETFLYTHIDTEGTMQGIPMQAVQQLHAATTRKLIVAGGIREQAEIDRLEAMGIDAVVGMAVYTGKIPA